VSRWHINNGDVLEVLKTMASNSMDALLSDPPYGISFMHGVNGKNWDSIVPSKEIWAEALRVLKPGAPLLAFGGTRTFHRLVCAIEDAGFEIRDSLIYMYGSGFPKSLDVSKAIDCAAGAVREVVGTNEDRLRRKPNGMKTDGANSYNYSQTQQETNADITAPATESARAWSGYGTALKPAMEPICLARKPLEGTVAANVARWGVGGLSIDASRIEATDKTPAPVGQYSRPSVGATGHSGIRNSDSDHLGRWPANVILDDDAGRLLDAMSGERPGMSGGGKHREGYAGGMFGGIDSTATARNDTGGASRFYYTAKASRAEREFGCDALPMRTVEETILREEGSAGTESPRAGANRKTGARNHHPTLKPIDLTRYLARLILPPARANGVRRILVPYSGVGSEMIGAMRAGWDQIEGIEMEADYVQIAEARLKRWSEVPDNVDPLEVKRDVVDVSQVPMFAMAGGEKGTKR
jgi:DNA modification methylase